MGKGGTLLHVRFLTYHVQETLTLLISRLSQCFYGVVWSVAVSMSRSPLTYAHRCSRLSILFTVVRLAYWGTQRRILICVAILFGVVWGILFAQVWWTCELNPSWKQLPRPQCPLGRDVAIAQIVSTLPLFNTNYRFSDLISADVLGDIVLILAPFLIIYRATLTTAQRVRVICLFSTSAITTAVSLTHAYFVFTVGELKEAVSAMFEVQYQHSKFRQAH